MDTPENTAADRLTDENVAAEFARLTERPAVRPDIAELLARHADEAQVYRSTPYDPDHPPAPVARPTEPMPGWAKGVALAAPTVGGGVWLASAGVESVMNAASVEVAACLGLIGLVVWAAGQTAAKRGPRKVINNNDFRGSVIDKRKAIGLNYKSQNG